MWRIFLLILVPTVASADSLVASRVIKAQSTITAEDLMLVSADIPGAISDAAKAIGLEARAAIYPGRPIMDVNLGPATLVERNQLVTLSYVVAGLTIRAEGRALSRGSIGDFIEVMNLSSRTKLTGRVDADGGITVGPMLLP